MVMTTEQENELSTALYDRAVKMVTPMVLSSLDLSEPPTDEESDVYDSFFSLLSQKAQELVDEFLAST